MLHRLLDLLGVFLVVPERVDLVERGHLSLVVVLAMSPDVQLPHVNVAARDARVGGEHEQHGVRVGQHAQREFGIAAEGVDARSVEDCEFLLHQSVFKTVGGGGRGRGGGGGGRRGGGGGGAV